MNVALDFHLKVRSDLMIIYTLKAVKKTNTSQGLRSDHIKCNLGSFSKDRRHTEKQTLRIDVSLSDGMQTKYFSDPRQTKIKKKNTFPEHSCCQVECMRMRLHTSHAQRDN